MSGRHGQPWAFDSKIKGDKGNPQWVTGTVATTGGGSSDSNTNLTASNFAISWEDQILVTQSVAKASAGTAYQVTAYNDSGNNYYLQLFDRSSFAVSGSIPLESYRVPSNSTLSRDYGLVGRDFSNGFVVGWSEVNRHFSASTAVSGNISVGYK